MFSMLEISVIHDMGGIRVSKKVCKKCGVKIRGKKYGASPRETWIFKGVKKNACKENIFL